MNLNDRFKVEVNVVGNKAKVVLKGAIDEDSDFSPILKTSGPVSINFKEVQSINSLGIRSWVNFLKDLSNREVHYEECPPIIVRQLNMVPSFLGKAKVLSVFVPYVSDDTDEEKLVLVPSQKFEQNGFSIDETLKEGGQEYELDGHPQQYFAFAKKAA